MTEWILICNSNYFNIKEAFTSQNTITWPQLNHVLKEDIVYCYVTYPFSSILYKCEVSEINLNRMDESSKEYVKHALFYENRQIYMRLKRLRSYREGILSDTVLRKYGISSLQMSSKVSSELSEAIEKQNRLEKRTKVIKWVGGISVSVAMILGIVGFYYYHDENKMKDTTTPKELILESENDSKSELSEDEKLWYSAYKQLSEHTKLNGVECITHSREERQQVRNALLEIAGDDVVVNSEYELWCSNSNSVNVSIRDYDPYDPGQVGMCWSEWEEGSADYYPDNFPCHIGESRDEVMDKLGITDDMLCNIDIDGSDELEEVSISYFLDNSIAGLEFLRTDNTSIELMFSSDNEKLERINFNDLNDYSDVAKKLIDKLSDGEEKAIAWNSGLPIEIGDIVSFGRYEQDNSSENGTEDILWYVVSSAENEFLLVSCRGLEFVMYGEDVGESMTWSGSYVRNWLQSDFYYQAFDDEEKNAIVTKTLETIDDSEHVVGEVTQDTVFLLSPEEADTYLSSSQRPMLITDYAKNEVGWNNITTCGNYLRSYNSRMTGVLGDDSHGELRNYRCDYPMNYYPPVAVRPAVWIKR